MRFLVLAICLVALAACRSTPMRPAWLAATLANESIGGIAPALVDQAAADPDHFAHLRASVRAPDPANPRAAQEARSLSHLIIQLHFRNNNDPAYLALARDMHAADPEHHGYTLAAIAEGHLPATEAELLNLAFDPLALSSGGRKSAASTAACILIAQLAFNTPQLPRILPAGAPDLTAVESTPLACWHLTLRAGYGKGDLTETAARVNAILDNPESKLRPGNDHEVEDCRTVIWRLTELGGARP